MKNLTRPTLFIPVQKNMTPTTVSYIPYPLCYNVSMPIFCVRKLFSIKYSSSIIDKCWYFELSGLVNRTNVAISVLSHQFSSSGQHLTMLPQEANLSSALICSYQILISTCIVRFKLQSQNTLSILPFIVLWIWGVLAILFSGPSHNSIL